MLGKHPFGQSLSNTDLAVIGLFEMIISVFSQANLGLKMFSKYLAKVYIYIKKNNFFDDTFPFTSWDFLLCRSSSFERLPISYTIHIYIAELQRNLLHCNQLFP